MNSVVVSSHHLLVKQLKCPYNVLYQDTDLLMFLEFYIYWHLSLTAPPEARPYSLLFSNLMR